MRPPLTYDMNSLDRGQVTVLSSFQPDASGWANAGYPVVQDLADCDMAIVVVPRTKALARAMIAEAATKAKVVVVDGAKTDGVDSLFKACAEALSLACARENVQDPRATFIWGDATTHQPPTAYDGIIMNPPFHTIRAADPSLGRDFITSAARMLAGHGKLWMVANRHLPYEQTLRDAFRNVDIIAQNNAFKVFHATRPKRG